MAMESGFIRALIDDVENSPWLWQKSHEDFMDKDKRENSWNSISARLNKPAEVCRSKWKYLRDQYKKLKLKSAKTPSGSGRLPAVNWPWYAAMEFCDQEPGYRKTSGNMASSNDGQNDDEESLADADGTVEASADSGLDKGTENQDDSDVRIVDTHHDDDDDQAAKDDHWPDAHYLHSIQEDSTRTPPSSESAPETTHRATKPKVALMEQDINTPTVKPENRVPKRKVFARRSSHDVDNLLVSLLQKKALAKSDQDEDTIFGQLVGARVRSLTGRNKRQTKTNIMRLLDEAQEMEEEPPSTRRGSMVPNFYTIDYAASSPSASSSSSTVITNATPPPSFCGLPGNSNPVPHSDATQYHTLQPANIEESLESVVNRAVNY